MKKSTDYLAKPDRKFTVENKVVNTHGPVLLLSGGVFRVERKHKKKCEENRQKKLGGYSAISG